MLEIYQYNRASQFIRDAWIHKKKKNPAFSLRAWSRQLGFANNAPLSLMLAGKRPVPKKYLPNFISSLGLSSDEGLYLETLLDFERAKGIKAKSFYEERLKTLAPGQPISFHEIESFKLLGDPLHSAILEMTDLRGFKPRATWIKDRIRWVTTVGEIEEAVRRLVTLGLLTKSGDGQWHKTQQHLSNRPDIADQGSQEYHRNVSQIAAEQVAIQEVFEREFNGYAINIKRTDLSKAKRLIRAFIKDFAAKIEARPQSGDQTYQLNVQFFGITKGQEK